MTKTALALVLACGLAGCGNESPPVLGAGPGSDAGSDSDADSDSDTDSDSDSDSNSDSDSDSDADCIDTQQIPIDWSEATIVDPMHVEESTQIENMFYILTWEAYAGSAVATFEVPCHDTWYVWGAGFVMANEMAAPNDFTVRVDGGDELTWLLTGENEWLWNLFSPEGDESPFEFEMASGPGHTFTVYGGDSTTMGPNLIAPALGDVVLVNDPEWTPSLFGGK